ncbi:MAG: hypothetical protein LPK45_10325, partial [Bacteroidota bacterium]|nr:hypothetical protein [Bacteroidota bacterium]MDX5431493.1 hypothetical protein [Bacteroidota bacterium]MDX5470217.1 hypothetical protein [Bacteroidota bacterium]
MNLIRSKNFLWMVGAIAFLSACKKDESGQVKLNDVPEFFQAAPEGTYGTVSPELKVLATSSNQLNGPTDLDFHPTRHMELWVINYDDEMTGGSTLTIRNAGKSNQEIEWRRDGNAWHFMALPPAMAFSENGNWASTANIQDANRQGGSFTGPSLWSSDMN